jgi:hypothetical protein
MLTTDWKHLDMIMERIGQLAQRADAAAAAGDLNFAAYLKEQARLADQDRQRTVDRLSGQVCQTV